MFSARSLRVLSACSFTYIMGQKDSHFEEVVAFCAYILGVIFVILLTVTIDIFFIAQMISCNSNPN